MSSHVSAEACAVTEVTASDELAEAVGVLSRSTLARHPEAAQALRRKVWRRYGHVVVTHNGPLSEEQRTWVALLNSGHGAVLAAATAMLSYGVRVDPPPRPQIVVPAWRSAPRVADADVRRSRLLGPTEVHPVRQPPMLRLARATLDATSLTRTPDDSRAILCAPIQQRKLRVPDLRTALGRVGPLTGRSVVTQALDDLEFGAQTVHELAFARALRRGGLPQPDRQVMARRPDGKAYLDGWWEKYDLHAEIDGLAHMWVANWAADLLRANDLEIERTARRLRFAGFQVLEQEAQVIQQVRRALIAGGWRP